VVVPKEKKREYRRTYKQIKTVEVAIAKASSSPTACKRYNKIIDIWTLPVMRFRT